MLKRRGINPVHATKILIVVASMIAFGVAIWAADMSGLFIGGSTSSLTPIAEASSTSTITFVIPTRISTTTFTWTTHETYTVTTYKFIKQDFTSLAAMILIGLSFIGFTIMGFYLGRKRGVETK